MFVTTPTQGTRTSFNLSTTACKPRQKWGQVGWVTPETEGYWIDNNSVRLCSPQIYSESPLVAFTICCYYQGYSPGSSSFLFPDCFCQVSCDRRHQPIRAFVHLGTGKETSRLPVSLGLWVSMKSKALLPSCDGHRLRDICCLKWGRFDGILSPQRDSAYPIGIPSCSIFPVILHCWSSANGISAEQFHSQYTLLLFLPSYS